MHTSLLSAGDQETTENNQLVVKVSSNSSSQSTKHVGVFDHFKTKVKHKRSPVSENPSERSQSLSNNRRSRRNEKQKPSKSPKVDEKTTTVNIQRQDSFEDSSDDEASRTRKMLKFSFWSMNLFFSFYTESSDSAKNLDQPNISQLKIPKDPQKPRKKASKVTRIFLSFMFSSSPDIFRPFHQGFATNY